MYTTTCTTIILEEQCGALIINVRHVCRRLLVLEDSNQFENSADELLIRKLDNL